MPATQYTVKSGDTLTSIAKGGCVTVGQMIAANPSLSAPGANPNLIKPGQTLTIPNPAFSKKLVIQAGTIKCKTDPETVCDYAALVKKVEAAHPGWSADRVANALRSTAGYDSPYFQSIYGGLPPGDKLTPTGNLTQQDIDYLKSMSKHVAKSLATETGVARDSTGQSVALGHVITGISAGMHPQRAITPTTDSLQAFGAAAGFLKPMDNLHATTLAGDLGQYASFLGAGKPLEAELDATHAELTGDIDGFMLGDKIRSGALKIDPSTKLSGILSDYYGCQGQKSPGVSTRFGDFAKSMNPAKLKKQVEAFSTNYNYLISMPHGFVTNTTSEAATSITRFNTWMAQQQAAEQQRNAAAATKKGGGG